MTTVDLRPFQRLYPFRSNYLDTPAGRIHYIDEGPRDAPVMLMLHGNPTWSFYYRNLITAFRGTHRVVAPDHLGCGLSDKPQDFDYTLANHIANVTRLVAALGLRDITLVVHDWGGPIGMGFAVDHPELIERQVVFNTAAFLSSRMPFLLALARVPGFGALLIRGANAFARGALMTCVVHKERLTPEVRAGYLAPYDDWEHRIATLRFVLDIPTKPRDPAYARVLEIDQGLPRLAARPMLIIWGAKDFVFDQSFLAGWTQRFPSARVELIEDAGHYVVEDAHERIVPWMSAFIAETKGRRDAQAGTRTSSSSTAPVEAKGPFR